MKGYHGVHNQDPCFETCTTLAQKALRHRLRSLAVATYMMWICMYMYMWRTRVLYMDVRVFMYLCVHGCVPSRPTFSEHFPSP